MLRKLICLCAILYGAQAFSRNAIELGLVSEDYPLAFWDALATMKEAELGPEFQRLILYLDRSRAGDEYVIVCIVCTMWEAGILVKCY